MSAYATFVKQGVRYRFFKTHANRWSNGKVHLQLWRREIKEWVLVCRADDTGPFSGYFGMVLECGDNLTCKKCIKLDPRP